MAPLVRTHQVSLRFAEADTLSSVLGVTQGAVSPLAVVNDSGCQATLAIDKALVETSEKILVHPLRNDRTVSLSAADLNKVGAVEISMR